jgi:hypothetical protein
MSPKYENRRKEFFATYLEFLRNYVRDKYYEFMNDIQTEVNFFEWFDHYLKPKILAGRNTNTSFSSSTNTSPPLTTSTKTSLDKVIHTHAITPPNTLNTIKSTSHTPSTPISNNPNAIIKNKDTNYEDTSTNHKTSNTKTHPCELSNNGPKQQITDNLLSTTKQTLMSINNTSQQDTIDLAKKQMQTINRTTQNWLKVESKEVVHEKFPPYESIIINHRNHQLLASPIKNASLNDETKNFEKIIEQNNYSNTYLKIIGAKLDRIENKINPIKPTTKLDIEKPLLTLHEIPPKLRVSFKKDNTDLLEEISKRLQTLDITNIASSSQIKEQANQSKRINTIDKIKQENPNIEEYIENLQNQFKDLNINRIANERDFYGKPLRSRIARTRYSENVSITRNFYSRPTPPDL